MDGVLIPLAVFAAVVVIVGLVTFSGLHDRELTALDHIRQMEAEHRQRMAELDRELQQVRLGDKPAR